MATRWRGAGAPVLLSRSEEHTSELQSRGHLVCRLLLEKKKNISRHERLRHYRRSHRQLAPTHVRRRRLCFLQSDMNLHFFFFNDTATTEIYTLSLHDALPI